MPLFTHGSSTNSKALIQRHFWPFGASFAEGFMRRTTPMLSICERVMVRLIQHIITVQIGWLTLRPQLKRSALQAVYQPNNLPELQQKKSNINCSANFDIRLVSVVQYYTQSTENTFSILPQSSEILIRDADRWQHLFWYSFLETYTRLLHFMEVAIQYRRIFLVLSYRLGSFLCKSV